MRLGCAHDNATCARQSILALCHERDLRVATLFPRMLGGLGRDRGLLCRDRDFSSMCRDRNSVSLQGLGVGPGLGRDKGLLMSRQGLGVGQGLGCDKVSLCRNRAFLRVGHSCRDRRLYVGTEIPRVVLRQDVFLS